MNNSGQVVGSVYYKGHSRAFLYDRGAIIILPALRGVDSDANAISGAGVIAGTARTRCGADPLYKAVVWINRRIRPLPMPTWEYLEVRGVNNKGDIVGMYSRRLEQWGFIAANGRIRTRVRLAKGLYLREAYAITNRGAVCGRCASGGKLPALKRSLHVCIWDRIRLSVYGDPGEFLTGPIPVAMNDSNMIVGNIKGLEDVAVFTIKNGKYEDLERDYFHWVTGLNNHGTYVGAHCTGNLIQEGPFRATLWENGLKYDLNDLIPRDSGWELGDAFAINDNGVIVGIGKRWGHKRTFLFIPLSVPEG